MVMLNDLMKGTIYRARIVAYNDRGVGTFTDFFMAQMRVDRKLLTMLKFYAQTSGKISVMHAWPCILSRQEWWPSAIGLALVCGTE